MKKLVSIMMALMVVCLAAGALAAVEAADVLGTWYAVSAEQDGASIDLGMMGMSMTLELKEDGTLTLDNNGEANKGTWTLTETGFDLKDDSGNGGPVTLADGKLRMEIGGGTMIFSREPAQSFTPPKQVAAESEEAFLGKYELTTIDMMGQAFLPASALKMSATMTIEPGKVTIESVSPALDEQGNIVQDKMETQTVTYETKFADGQLHYTDNSTFMTVESIIALNEDGTLYTGASMDVTEGASLNFGSYYQKID